MNDADAGSTALSGPRHLATWRRIVGWLKRRVCAPGDNDETRLRKFHFTLATVLIIPAGLVWAGLYVAFNEPAAALIPLGYSILALTTFALFLRLRRFRLYQRSQLSLILVLPFALQLSLGGFAASGVVIVWAFLAVIMALPFGGREARFWFGAFLAEIILAAVLQPHLRVGNNLPAWLVTVFFVMNIGAVASIAFAVQESFLRDRQKLRELEVAYLNQEMMLRQSEKLATLGTLAAGVAHELNNPAAAVSRGVVQLRPLFEGLQTAYLDMRSALSAEQTASLKRVDELMRQQAGRIVSLSPLDRSDRQDEMAGWFRGLGVERPADAASALVDLGYTPVQLEALTTSLPPENVPSFLSWLARAGAAEKLLAEVGEGAGRISQIVHAMKSYAYLDQAPLQDVDVIEGLENTLVLLGSKLRGGVVVRRQYAEDLPRIEAYGSELNQVWTNIIQNAIDAMDGSGNITLRVSTRDGYVLVEIEDDGPEMPPEVAAQVFDPFFTTKAPGQGTGLGLNISYNIVVQKHKGGIEVDSEPGRTRFRVSLPIGGPGRPSD